ncbi:hypothetical protein ACTXT7_008414 [Hymenolepis weldensis]
MEIIEKNQDPLEVKRRWAELHQHKTMSAVFNLTTNELANWRRYEYFGNAKTGFKNPFNKGCWSNIVEFFCPHYYVTERELFRKRGAVDKEYPFVV